jgi:hypothetical protein
MKVLIVAFLAMCIVVPIGLVAYVLWVDLCLFQQEQQRYRDEFERMNAIFGPIMKQWEEELREEGLLVPPGTKRM